MSSGTLLSRFRGPLVAGAVGLLLLVIGVFMITAEDEPTVSAALRSSGAFDPPRIAEPDSVPDPENPIAALSAVESPPTTTEPPQTTAPATTTTVATTTTAPVGYATAVEALYTALGYEDSMIIHCNSGEAGADNACWDQHAAYVYLFRPVFAEWYWVLVEEHADGTFDVIDVVAVEGEYDYPNSPWE